MLFSLQAALLLATWLNPVQGQMSYGVNIPKRVSHISPTTGCPDAPCPTGCSEGTIMVPIENSDCPDVCTCKECSGYITNTRKSVVNTPNYPAAYPENILCVWVFVAPPEATKVSVSFAEPFKIESVPLFLGCDGYQDYDEPPPGTFTTECIDVVVVFDVPTFPNSSSTTYCGVKPPPKTFAKDNVLVVVFNSVDTGCGRYHGFRAKFSACLPPKCPRCPYGRQVTEYDEHGCEACKCKSQRRRYYSRRRYSYSPRAYRRSRRPRYN